MINAYNYRLNTSNIEESEDDYNLKHQKIKLFWNDLTNFFFKKGIQMRIKYWPGDLIHGNIGFSGYGIQELIESDSNYLKEKDLDDLIVLSVVINSKVKDVLSKSMGEYHITNTPFFHFDIVDENGLLLYTSQDFGDNVLMLLNEEDYEKLSSLTDYPLLISIPEKLE